MSLLSQNTKRLGQILRDGAEAQVGESGQRLEGASNTYWPLIHKLLVSNFSFEGSYRKAQQLFNGSHARFAAVDGSLVALGYSELLSRSFLFKEAVSFLLPLRQHLWIRNPAMTKIETA